MHPADVSDLLTEEVAELQTQLGNRGDLQVRAVDRAGPAEVRVTVCVSTRKSETVTVQSRLVGPDGNQLLARQMRVPLLGATTTRDLVLRVKCDDWDGQPPEIDLLETDGSAVQVWPLDSGGQGIVHNHPDYSRPFFCRPGTREYHSHPAHADDPWDKHREGMTLPGLVINILNDLTYRWTMQA